MLPTISSNAEDPIKKKEPEETKHPAVESKRADRRGERRALIAVPMLARWTDARKHELKVNSRDISDGGIFFHSNSDIAIGTEVEVTFTLPSDPGTAGNKRLRVQGTVVRAERETGKTGYALAITGSELLEMDDTVAQARQAGRRLNANNVPPSGPFRSRRARILLLACGALLGSMMLAGLSTLLVRRVGSPAKVVAAIGEMAASIRSNPQNEQPAPADIQQNKVESKRKTLRTGEPGAAEKKAALTPGPEPGTVESNHDATTLSDQSLANASTVQPGAVSFNNNNVLTLDLQKGKPVSELGYIGDLPSPPTEPVSKSGASTSTTNHAAAAGPSSTAVVLRVVVGRDGRVEDVQRASGPAELSSAFVAAIRRSRFQPDPGGARHTEIYVTVNFTISPR
jgi:TonB family protein